jgi:general secretion pathway protein F
VPTYFYKATDSDGKIVEGAMEAMGEKEVVSSLQDKGYIPIRVKLPKEEAGEIDLGVSKRISTLFKRISTKDVMLFTQDLSMLLGAGLPVDRALSILIDVSENERFQEVIREILKGVQGGNDLSETLAQHPSVFSNLYVNMVRAGEVGGVLEAVLDQLGDFLESVQDLKDYIKSAMVYPLFLVFIGGASLIILLTFVIPKFAVIFSDLGQAVPLSTRFLLGLSELLRVYWWVILGGLLILSYGLWRYAGTPGGRLRLDQYKMAAPIIGETVKKIEVARFARTLGTLIKNGVPILHALILVKDIIGNQVVAGCVETIYDRVKEGERLSRPLEAAGIFPSLAIQMVTVGEESGRLDEMLLRVADNYEKAIRNMVKRLISLLEPAMILVMGLVVGFIVISMLMAIFSVNEIPF